MHDRARRLTRPTLLMLSAGLAAALLATARPSRADEPARAAETAVRYQFEDDKVMGDTVAPIGEVMVVRARGERASLVRAREGFVRELLRSVEAL